MPNEYIDRTNYIITVSNAYEDILMEDEASQYAEHLQDVVFDMVDTQIEDQQIAYVVLTLISEYINPVSMFIVNNDSLDDINNKLKQYSSNTIEAMCEIINLLKGV